MLLTFRGTRLFLLLLLARLWTPHVEAVDVKQRHILVLGIEGEGHHTVAALAKKNEHITIVGYSPSTQPRPRSQSCHSRHRGAMSGQDGGER